MTVQPEQPIDQALEVVQRFRMSGLPVTRGGQLVGVFTNRDLRFEKRLDRTVADVTTREKLVMARPGVTLEEAKEILHRYRIEKRPVVDERNQPRGSAPRDPRPPPRGRARGGLSVRSVLPPA